MLEMRFLAVYTLSMSAHLTVAFYTALYPAAVEPQGIL